MTHWRPVEGYVDAYVVSDNGTVKSLSRLMEFRPGRFGERKGRVLRQSLTQDGYPRLQLNYRGVFRCHRVHQLVATAFLGPCPVGCEVNHKSGVKTDNSVANLEYITKRANIQHSYRVLGNCIGSRHKDSILVEGDIPLIRTMVRAGLAYKTIGRCFGVTADSIFSVVRRSTWTHVPEDGLFLTPYQPRRRRQ